MKKMLILIILVFLLPGILSSCATSTEPADAYKGETPESIYQHGHAALKDNG